MPKQFFSVAKIHVQDWHKGKKIKNNYCYSQVKKIVPDFRGRPGQLMVLACLEAKV